MLKYGGAALHFITSIEKDGNSSSTLSFSKACTYIPSTIDYRWPYTLCCLIWKLNSYAIYICESLAKFYLPKPIHTYSFMMKLILQTYILMSWIKIDFFGMRLRSWSFCFFLCNLHFASLFIHALWVFTSGILQTSLDIHPKPKISFYDNPYSNWVVVKEVITKRYFWFRVDIQRGL